MIRSGRKIFLYIEADIHIRELNAGKRYPFQNALGVRVLRDLDSEPQQYTQHVFPESRIERRTQIFLFFQRLEITALQAQRMEMEDPVRQLP